MNPRILIAGIGNVFFGDDGFGCEVARRLLHEEPIAGARVEDYGIRGLHLAYDLVAGYEAAILIDAVSREDRPGTLFVIEPSERVKPGGTPDAHRMDLSNVFAFVTMIGGHAPPITIVGCEPATIDECMGLSPAVAQAVEPALSLVRRVALTVVQGKEPAWSEVSS